MLPNLGGLRLEPRDECAPTGPFYKLTNKDGPQTDPISLEPLPKNKTRKDEGATFALKTPNNADGSRPEREYNFYDAKKLAEHVHTKLKERQAPKDPMNNQEISRKDLDLLVNAYPPPSDDADADRVEPLDEDGGDRPDWAQGWLAEHGRPERQYWFVRPFDEDVVFSWRTTYERSFSRVASNSLARAAGLSAVPPLQTSSYFEVKMCVGERRSPAFVDYFLATAIYSGGRVDRLYLDEAAASARHHNPFLPEGYPDDAYALLNKAYADNAGWLGTVPTWIREPPDRLNLIEVDIMTIPPDLTDLVITYKVAPQLVRLLVLRRLALAAGAPDPLLALVDAIRVMLGRADADADLRPLRGQVPAMEEIQARPEAAQPPLHDTGITHYLFWNGHPDDDCRPDDFTWKHSLVVLLEGHARLVQWAERFGGPVGSADPSEFLLASEPQDYRFDDRWTLGVEAETAAERLAVSGRFHGGVRATSAWRSVPTAQTFDFTCFAAVPIFYWRAREHAPEIVRQRLARHPGVWRRGR